MISGITKDTRHDLVEFARATKKQAFLVLIKQADTKSSSKESTTVDILCSYYTTFIHDAVKESTTVDILRSYYTLTLSLCTFSNSLC